MTAMEHAVSLENFLARAKDIPAVIDALTRWNAQADHPLKGRLDLNHLGMSGHSFGAIYPTEYEPPSLAGSFTSGDGKDKSLPSSNMPTAFETRNLGNTLEIEPTVDANGKIIDLRFVPELVWHTGDTVWGEGKDALGMPFKISMPDIYTMRLNTAICCISGQYTFVGAVSPKDAKGNTDTTRKVVVFVKCDVLTVK